MAGEWPRLSLREAKITLIDCDHRTPPASQAGYPYVAIPQLRNGRIDLSDVRRITPENFVEWTRKAKPLPNDVVLSRRCNPGETAFVPPGLEFALGQNLVLLRADGTMVYPPFLRWLVRGPEWWEQIGKFLNVGAVFDSLRCADIPNFELRIPPLPEQRAIAHILGTLDDKIELDRQMNETLEAMARAIFKSWFVDCDPVRAKAEGRDSGLPKHIADLFPDCFEDSELGEIPAGWEVNTLGNLIGLAYGKALKEEVRKSG
jgi:type I restriction enzyme S subunit